MAFDGITVAAIVAECKDKLIGGRINKIAQPEKDELILTVKSGGENLRLLLSADASLPLCYFTQENKKSPMTAPNFCMLLRKHISGGRITNVSQPGLERIICFEIEHLDEMGDLCHKKLLIELMGKHSNIIFTDEKNKIIDSIKHISGAVSSVREVLPGRDYFIPSQADKKQPLEVSGGEFGELLTGKSMPLFKAIYSNLTGFSPVISHEIAFLAKVDGDKPSNSLTPEEISRVTDVFGQVCQKLAEENFSPTVYYENGVPKEYAAFSLESFLGCESKTYDTMSELLFAYYNEKNIVTRVRQRSVDLRKIVTTALERNVKKYDLQAKQLKDTEKRDTYRIYGELLNTYGYSAQPGDKSLEALNYYTNETVTIPLDPTLTATENARKYFEKFLQKHSQVDLLFLS